MNRFGSIAAVGVIAACTATQAHALTAREIVEKANEASYYAGQDGRAKVKMTIADAKGGTRQREFTILRMNTKGSDQKFYVYFQEPADVRKMAYLVWKHVGEGEDDDRWMWLPALNLVRRIAPGDQRTSFVGSDFVYEDVSGRHIDADDHEIDEETDTQYVLKSTPKDPDSVEFDHYKVKIDKDSFLPRKAEYWDKQGNLCRTVEAAEVENIQGYPTVVKSVVRDLKTGGHTVNTISDVKYDIGLKETIFSERFLRRPPREVLRR